MTTIEKNIRDKFRKELENDGREFAKTLSKSCCLDEQILEEVTGGLVRNLETLCGRYAAETGKTAPEVILKFGVPGNYGSFWYDILEKMILFVPLCCCIDTAAIRLGLRNWVLMAVISVVLGLSIVYAVFIARNIYKRRQLRKWLAAKYEKEIIPELINWFDK